MSDGSLCSLVAFCPCQGSGFLFPLLTVPSGRLFLHPSLFFLTPQPPPLPLLQTSSVTMSPSTTPVIPSAPLPSIFTQATLENGYDHLRDHASDGGYMGYGVRFSGLEPTYMQVRSWD